MSANYRNKPDRLIINSPFKEPALHWEHDKTLDKFYEKDGRREAGYVIASQSKKYSEHGDIVSIPLVNEIRPRVKKWRKNHYQGVTGITKRLLKFWRDKGADGREFEFFFCQLEAIETLIWLKESHPTERTGLVIEKDGGAFERLCCKMATGTGKTYVMAMAIAWQILNKVTYPQDARFAKNIFIVAPNLTVKSRLSVLNLTERDNYYEYNKIVPYDLLDKLRQGKVRIENWHILMWETEEQIIKRRSVDKRGVKSNEAWTRDVLQDMAKAKNILVINDEAHHAWRKREDDKRSSRDKEVERATCWIQGLDRLHKTRNILSCLDFSATPFAPSGRKKKASYDEDLFKWIVSDFGLMDAIESGLTKTPRFVVRDDGRLTKDYKSKFYHIYDDEDVRENLNRSKAKPSARLPELVREAYHFLTLDWRETFKDWQKNKMLTPPVMITAANRKETAARIEYAFLNQKRFIDELTDAEKTTLIYSDIESDKQDDLREKVNSVGQRGKTGEQIRHVISVAMLTEGWNCQTVTHIMGLRAFSSQLLCEQIVGRGLRRTSYELNSNGLFDPEYVNIFGIPFSFIPHEDAGDGNPRPPSRRMPIFPHPDNSEYQITWPNIERIDRSIKPKLRLDLKKIKPLQIDEVRTIAELAPEIDGQPDYDRITEINLEKLAGKTRLQSLLFQSACDIYDDLKADCSWTRKINKEYAIKQIIALTEKLVMSDKFEIHPPTFINNSDKRRDIAIMMGMEDVVRGVFHAITLQNTEEIAIRYRDPKYRSTKDAVEWRTAKNTKRCKKTHMNHCVVDSTWEAVHARELDKSKDVVAWVKNDHLGFEIPYRHGGMLRNYIPDFIVKLTNGTHLLLEVKGLQRAKDESKRKYAKNWVKAVSQDGDHGHWEFRVSEDKTGQIVHIYIAEMMNR